MTISETRIGGFLPFVDRTEGGGRYDTLFAHAQRTNTPLRGVDVTNKTIDELRAFSGPSGPYGQWSKQKLGYRATPMGRFQFVGTTMAGVADRMGLSGDTKFTPEIQNAMFENEVSRVLSSARDRPSQRQALRGVWEGFKNASNAELDRAIEQFQTGRPVATAASRTGSAPTPPARENMQLARAEMRGGLGGLGGLGGMPEAAYVNLPAREAQPAQEPAPMPLAFKPDGGSPQALGLARPAPEQRRPTGAAAIREAAQGVPSNIVPRAFAPGAMPDVPRAMALPSYSERDMTGLMGREPMTPATMAQTSSAGVIPGALDPQSFSQQRAPRSTFDGTMSDVRRTLDGLGSVDRTIGAVSSRRPGATPNVDTAMSDVRRYDDLTGTMERAVAAPRSILPTFARRDLMNQVIPPISGGRDEMGRNIPQGRPFDVENEPITIETRPIAEPQREAPMPQQQQQMAQPRYVEEERSGWINPAGVGTDQTIGQTMSRMIGGIGGLGGTPAAAPADMPAMNGAVAQSASIDRSRPILENNDGSFSTEETITVGFDDGVFNIPTIVNGQRVDEETAVRLFREGKNPPVGRFNTQEEAVAAAQSRSQDIGRTRGSDRAPPAQPQGVPPTAQPAAAPQAPQQAGGGVLGFLRSEGFGNFLQALGTSLMSSPRNNPLAGFGPAMSALNAASEGRALKRQEAGALVTALVENGVPLAKAQAVAFNPAAARILLEGTQKQAELAREEAARRADQERVDALMGGQGTVPSSIPAQPAQGATPQGEAAPGQDTIEGLEQEIVQNRTLAARYAEGTQSRAFYAAKAEQAKAQLDRAVAQSGNKGTTLNQLIAEYNANPNDEFAQIRLRAIEQEVAKKGMRLAVDSDGRITFEQGGGVNPAGGGGNVNENLNAGFVLRGRSSHEVISNLESEGTSMLNKIYMNTPGGLGNYMLTPEGQQYDQAKRDFINATLRRESGAVIADSEFENADVQYFPQPGDSPQVIEQKRINRANVVRAMEMSAGIAVPPPGDGVAPPASNDDGWIEVDGVQIRRKAQ